MKCSLNAFTFFSASKKKLFRKHLNVGSFSENPEYTVIVRKVHGMTATGCLSKRGRSPLQGTENRGPAQVPGHEARYRLVKLEGTRCGMDTTANIADVDMGRMAQRVPPSLCPPF